MPCSHLVAVCEASHVDWEEYIDPIY
ncbi:hypothetical protein [Bartonella sp. AC134YNZD]